VIKYIGSKRLLVPGIVAMVEALGDVRTVVDLFSGTSRVGLGLKAAGFQVRANDVQRYAATLARAYIQADDDRADQARRILGELDTLPAIHGYFTETFCTRARFFQPKNGAKVDAIREGIRRLDADPELEAILLVALMEAADRVDSTTGLHMAYLKSWAPRAHGDLALRLPELLPRARAGKGEAHERDAQDAIGDLDGDLIYLDPPYNQHKYRSNYHIWETLVRWDAPEAYGVAQKRIDCREEQSPYNRRATIVDALRDIVRRARARYLLVSFNDEGFVPRADMEAILAERGPVEVIAHAFPRYVGAKIGIHNPKGEKVGKVSHVRNTEFLYLVRVSTR
jgi:adenine-specific DNA-methyltransferase